MFEGFGFRILVLVVIVLTLALGLVGGLAGWVAIIVDKSRTSSTKVPYALYTLALFVLVQVASQQVIRNFTYNLAAVWSLFLPSALACVATWLAVRKNSGPTTKVPYALYTLTLFVLFQFAGLLAVQELSPAFSPEADVWDVDGAIRVAFRFAYRLRFMCLYRAACLEGLWSSNINASINFHTITDHLGTRNSFVCDWIVEASRKIQRFFPFASSGSE